MSLFDKLVNEAISNKPELSALKIVVEKELLHHDILRILSQNNMLKDLTFIGGTCLRVCYGALRLSEDLDFVGGVNFSKSDLSSMADILIKNLNDKYGLQVSVTEPIKDSKNVSTWKIKIQTRPKQKNLAAQRINIDICALPSYERQPMMLLNFYGVDMGTNGLVVQAQTLEEIYTDKLIAFAFRPNRIKYRDLWDIIWLHQQNIKPRLELIVNKIKDRKYDMPYFLKQYKERYNLLKDDENLFKEFTNEMQRFLPVSEINKINKDLWSFIVYLINNIFLQIQNI